MVTKTYYLVSFPGLPCFCSLHGSIIHERGRAALPLLCTTLNANRRAKMGEAWECIVPPTGSVFLKQRVGYRVRQGFHFGLFQKGSCTVPDESCIHHHYTIINFVLNRMGHSLSMCLCHATPSVYFVTVVRT